MIVSSNIVDKFYTDFEKMGLKRHKPSDEEVKYLESLDNNNMSIELINESNFLIQRIKFKLFFTKIFSLFFLLLGIVKFNFSIISFVSLFISILFFINIKYLNKRMRFQYFSKGLYMLNINDSFFDNYIN